VLQVSVLLLGIATGIFQLARHAYVAAVAPPDVRGRVLSTLGAMHRVGYFVGPFVGAAVIVGSSPSGAYWVAMGFAGATLAVLLAVRQTDDERAATASSGPAPSLWQVIVAHRRLFLTLGGATVLVGAVRGARQTVIPLWGAHLGLDAEVVSLIFGISGALDLLLFYPAGKVMDRFGRLWVAVPSMLLMGASMCLLPLTGSVVSLGVVAGLLGLANGLGSGIIMTLGADVAPAEGRSSFLGVWRLFQDCGEGAGPLVVAAGAALGSLAAGIWAAASFGLFSSAALMRWVPRYSSYGTRVRDQSPR
jgi:MFS family permease